MGPGHARGHHARGVHHDGWQCLVQYRTLQNGYYSSNISINFGEKHVGKKRGKTGGKSEKEKNKKELGRTDRKFGISISKSLSQNFGVERTLIDPISVTLKFHIFQRFLII